jgi:transcriptional regulator with XRE-family HTH domain
MTKRLGEIIKEARQARHLTLRGLTEQVTKEDGKPISPQYLFDIEEHHRVPAPHVLRELARVLDLEYDHLLAAAGAAEVVVREYLTAHPEQSEAIIKLFRAAQEEGFEEWEQLQKLVRRRARGKKKP